MASRSFAGDADAVAAQHARRDRGHARRAAWRRPPSTSLAWGARRANTDDGGRRRERPSRGDLAPFRAAVAQNVPLVMLSHALYPALDPRRIASQSPRVVGGLLRERLGFDGVVITDSIEAQAVLDRSGVATAAERSMRAGADLILTTGSASWNDVHPAAARAGAQLAGFRERVRRSAARVLALKRSLGLDLP